MAKSALASLGIKKGSGSTKVTKKAGKMTITPNVKTKGC